MQTQLYETLVDKHREEILAAEDYIWRHPETGFREWKTTAYMQDVFEKAGYTLVKAGDIPGFYTDIETGRPGPKLLIMAELDALSAPNHVQAVDGCAHACGHHAQCAAMAGIALALKEPGALDGLSGAIRLMCVPAEEPSMARSPCVAVFTWPCGMPWRPVLRRKKARPSCRHWAA